MCPGLTPQHRDRVKPAFCDTVHLPNNRHFLRRQSRPLAPAGFVASDLTNHGARPMFKIRDWLNPLADTEGRLWHLSMRRSRSWNQSPSHPTGLRRDDGAVLLQSVQLNVFSLTEHPRGKAPEIKKQRSLESQEPPSRPFPTTTRSQKTTSAVMNS